MDEGDGRGSAEAIGERIRAARRANGWTNEELAARVGVNWRTVQRWQSGALPRVKTLLKLADVLGVPQSYLVAEAEPPTLPELQRQVAELTRQVELLARALADLEPEAPPRPRASRRRPRR